METLKILFSIAVASLLIYYVLPISKNGVAKYCKRCKEEKFECVCDQKK